MSGTLTDPAPSDESAVPSIEDQAPGAVGEVVEGSAPGEQMIPVSRFNGLMGKFNQTQNELQKVRAELEGLRNQSPEESNPMSSEPSALEQQVATLTTMLMRERAENARRQVLDDHPELKPFADLLVGDDPDELRAVAEVFSERLKSVLPASQEPASEEVEPPAEPAAVTPEEPVTAPEGAAPPAVPVAGGGVPFSEGAATEDRVAETIKNRDFLGYLKAKREQLFLQGDEVLEG